MQTKNMIRLFAVFVLSGGLGFQVGKVVANAVKSAGIEKDAVSPWLLATVPVALLATILVHELGHVIGGWLAGMELHLLTAGPLRIERARRGFRWMWNRDGALWGGLAALAPPAERIPSPQDFRRRMLLLVAGGPLASLLLAGTVFPGWSLLESSPNAALLLLLTGGTSGAIALATLIPNSSFGFQSDGSRLWQLFRGGEAARLWCSLSAVASLANTQRPRQWPDHLMQELRQGQGTECDKLTAFWLLHSYHLDRDEWNDAKEALDHALEQAERTGGALRSLVHASAAYHFARLGDAGLAREHFGRANCRAFLRHGELDAIEAAVLAAEGRSGEARTVLERAEAQLQRKPEAQAGLYRELIEEVRLRLSPAQ